MRLVRVLGGLEQLFAVRLNKVLTVFDDFFAFGLDHLVCFLFEFELEVGLVLSLVHKARFGLLRSQAAGRTTQEGLIGPTQGIKTARHITDVRSEWVSR